MSRRHPSPIAIAFVVVATATVSFAADNAPSIKPIRIALVDDSTVASFANPPRGRPDFAGRGWVFGECFDNRVKVLNHARSGRSTKSFIAEGRSQETHEVQGDYIFLQFDHDDSHMKDGKALIDPDPAFRDYLWQYIS